MQLSIFENKTEKNLSILYLCLILTYVVFGLITSILLNIGLDSNSTKIPEHREPIIMFKTSIISFNFIYIFLVGLIPHYRSMWLMLLFSILYRLVIVLNSVTILSKETLDNKYVKCWIILELTLLVISLIINGIIGFFSGKNLFRPFCCKNTQVLPAIIVE